MNDVPCHMMKGVQLLGHGGPEMLVYREDLQVPQPGPGEVLIKVAAAGVNNTDINTRLAWYSKGDGDSEDASWSGQPLRFPRIQGADVCGRIVAVGRGVDDSRVGERVLIEPCVRESAGQELAAPWYFGSECDGGFAEFTKVASRHAYRIESALSDVELASFPCSYSTAENMLTRAQVVEGDKVLVTGASGGVGSAVVQLAKARGADVIAMTGKGKAQILRELGANQIVLRDQPLSEHVAANSVDVVIDLVAGEQWPEYLNVLRPGGRYAVAGAIAGPLVELDVRTLYLKDLSLLGCTVLAEEVFGNLVERIEQGQVAPLVAATFALDDIASAQQRFQEKHHVGKLVLDVGSQR
ncbi:alcohol dehydrogenase family protein [Halomonas denitrificans]|uniref:alcohol dehydrogenase family protein n=1 Tax=Halomonas TaxID=2745 RepID=UPI001C987299|nr:MULTISPECIES: alcohol dehydrogenase family protein [Halomonas]MBY5983444.1 alcohol dehydrogenase family protein [Halomonas sp. DP5Y7-2]MBY6031132.1 alcohol dehydrogenase family protein [Halomonas sp. DP8Y7-1]MBY6206253.1 alcohol dehydrogenase family protein [Halomonas sp. DP3Y7-2]MBY6227856.1 alcohol dehydrogenase family protein [Halomonas sp. DP3Y7-1]MCA0915923.1 alcohol dehydrogenase family protein [Halomonas denitrificans]